MGTAAGAVDKGRFCALDRLHTLVKNSGNGTVIPRAAPAFITQRLYYNRFPGRMQGKVVFFPYPLYFRAELCAENTEIFNLLFLSGPDYIIIGSNKSGPAARSEERRV